MNFNQLFDAMKPAVTLNGHSSHIQHNDTLSTPTHAQVAASALPLDTPQPNYALVRKVKMRDFGFESAGRHFGDAKALRNLFQYIWSGYVVDESTDLDRQQKRKERLRAEVDALETQQQAAESELKRVRDVEIPQVEAEVERLKDRVVELRLEEQERLLRPDALNKINLWTLGIVAALGLVYLIGFYISAVYSGMVYNPANDLKQADEATNLDSIFSSVFRAGAFTTFGFHWIGWMFILLFIVATDKLFLWAEEKKAHHPTASWKIWIPVGVMVFITFILDAFIAYKIEEMITTLKFMTGQSDTAEVFWLTSPNFWIVLLLGFIASLVFGVICYFLYKELSKKDPRREIAIKIEQCRRHEETLHQKRNALQIRMAELQATIEECALRIKQLTEQIHSLQLSKAELEKFVTDFFDGWLAYLNNTTDEAKKAECVGVMNAFRQEHFATQPTVVIAPPTPPLPPQ
ncbi:MAG: hypothetical protein ACK4GN_13695 [Runella sp.]